MFAKIDQTGWSNCNEGSQASPQLQAKRAKYVILIGAIIEFLLYRYRAIQFEFKALFRNKGFMLDEMFQQNASKFVMHILRIR